MKLNYSHGYYGVEYSTIYDKNLNRFLVSLSSEQLEPVIHYTLNGPDPDSNSLTYTKPFIIDSTTTIKAGIFSNGKLLRNISQQTIYIHKGIDKKIIYVDSPSPKYPGTGNETLLDGICGSENFSDGKWQGFEGNNFDVIIDLGKPVDVTRVSIDFLQNAASWIFMPKDVEISVSTDGIKYIPITIDNDIPAKTAKPVIKQFAASFNKAEVKFVHVKAVNIGVCPPWHPGAGEKAWLFSDEIIIQ
jgi:hexosaminidase